MTQRESAAVLGVAHATVQADLGGNRPDEPEPAAQTTEDAAVLGVGQKTVSRALESNDSDEPPIHAQTEAALESNASDAGHFRQAPSFLPTNHLGVISPYTAPRLPRSPSFAEGFIPPLGEMNAKSYTTATVAAFLSIPERTVDGALAWLADEERGIVTGGMSAGLGPRLVQR